MSLKVVPYIQAALITNIVNSKAAIGAFLDREELIRWLDGLITIVVDEKDLISAADGLIDLGVIDAIHDELAGNFYRVKKDIATGNYNASAADETTLIGRYARIGDSFLQRAVANDMSKSSDGEVFEERDAVETAPASDRIVKLDDNSPVREEIIGGLDVIQRAVAQSNDQDGKLGDQRERIIAEISAGKELLKAPSIRLKAISTVLIAVLGFIATEFAGGVIGELAVELLGKLKPLLGL